MDSLHADNLKKTTKMFQWGHDFSAMDRKITFGQNGEIVEFQWGHDFSAMDRAM